MSRTIRLGIPNVASWRTQFRGYKEKRRGGQSPPVGRTTVSDSESKSAIRSSPKDNHLSSSGNYASIRIPAEGTLPPGLRLHSPCVSTILFPTLSDSQMAS